MTSLPNRRTPDVSHSLNPKKSSLIIPLVFVTVFDDGIPVGGYAPVGYPGHKLSPQASGTTYGPMWGGSPDVESCPAALAQ